MIFRAARPEDHAGLLAYLERFEATSMFPMGNLLGKGLPTQHFLFEEDDQIAGYLGLAANGNLMPQASGVDWSAARTLLAGQTIAGILGPADQCPLVLAALGLADTPARVDKIEPGFTLDLAVLGMPDCTGLRLAAMRPQDLPLMVEWRAASEVEIMGRTAAEARADAMAEVARWLDRDTHRLLWRDDQPVSVCGINAALPQVVQVGGVYTPPECRNRGYARTAVALMLAEMRAKGVARALLFAASEQAARAYLAIGFRPSHRFAITLFQTPRKIPAWP